MSAHAPRERLERHLTNDASLTPIQKAKIELRYHYLSLRDQIRGADGLAMSRIIRDEIRAWEIFKNAKCISTYISIRSEVANHAGILRSLEAGKITCLPKVFGKEIKLFQVTNVTNDLMVGTFGVLEPKEHCKEIPLDLPELHIVPGVVFDMHGNRIGYGKGYYDRFLKRIPSSAITVGLAFDCQIADEIPAEPSDVPLDYIATPNCGIIKCS